MASSVSPTVMSSSLTHKWLRDAVQPYPDAQRVFAHVDALLTKFQALRPKSDVYSARFVFLPTAKH